MVGRRVQSRFRNDDARGAMSTALQKELAVGDVWRLYERHASDFDRDRSRSLFEKSYLEDVVNRLNDGAEVLDLGCGTGEPIARFFLEQGFRLTGVDRAPAMLALGRERLPEASWIEADMRDLDLGRRFAAILAWDSFFHLKPEDQRAMVPVFARHIAPRGLLLFTSGPAAGEVIGDWYGNKLFHASLDPDEYRSLLRTSGFEVIRHQAEDPDCAGHTVWLARAT